MNEDWKKMTGGGCMKIIYLFALLSLVGCEIPDSEAEEKDVLGCEQYFYPVVSIEYLYRNDPSPFYDYFVIQIDCTSDVLDINLGDLVYNITYDAFVSVMNGFSSAECSLDMSFENISLDGLLIENTEYTSITFYARVPDYSATPNGVVDVEVSGTVSASGSDIPHTLGPFIVSDVL